MDVSRLIIETLLDTGECLQLRLLLTDPGELVSESGPGHQQAGQGDQGGQAVAAKSQVNAAPQGLNLEAGDAITVQAATGSNKIQGAISYALIDRSQQNG